ncbi:cytochrome C assembly family protein [Oleidesulfovibrio sp.]|uniref:cytochrome C assembly family protein n=1 Tax=Oleidesulfovibrio sp. TaxID=2909707 RepID=UPI003A84B8C8
MTLVKVLTLTVIHLYVLATCAEFFGLATRRPRITKAASWITVAGFCAHTLLLAYNIFDSSWAEMTKGNYMQMLSWSMLLIYFIIWWRMRLAFLAITAAPLALILFIASLRITAVQSAFPASLSGLFFSLHIGSLFLSLGLMTMAFGAGLLFIYMDKKIKNKDKLSGFAKDMPSLNAFDRVNHVAVMSGFPLYTMGLASGFIWGRIEWGRVITWDPKELVSLVVWFLFALLFHHRLALGWRGRKAAVLAVWLFALTVFSLVGVNYFMPTHHSFQQ